MATNAILAVKQENGSVKSVSVYWDGDSALPILDQYYNTSELANELISYGNISSLGERIHPIGDHSFDNREIGTTTFYHRDRGDTLSIYEYTEKGWHNLEPAKEYEYAYIFDGIKWQQI